MTAPLSTSNSESKSQPDFFDDKPWSLAIIGSVFIVLVIILFFEYNLRSRHWTPTVNDSPELWAQERKRASQLGKEALILIGGSRIQLGIDLDELEKLSGKKPVQLAIDGANFYPVLKNLAEDTSITGDLIIDVHEVTIEHLINRDKAWDWVEAFEAIKKQPIYKLKDQTIKNFITQNMASKLEGAKPYKVINDLAFHPKNTTGNYLITNSNRSRDADYRKVKMPDFYVNRVIRHSALTLSSDNLTTFKEVLDQYEAAIPTIPQGDQERFKENLKKLIALINIIVKRGNDVVIVRMPTDKLLWKIDQQRYPLDLFWQVIKKQNVASIHFKDYPALQSFDLPDGSHLDQKDKKQFTNSLYHALTLLH